MFLQCSISEYRKGEIVLSIGVGTLFVAVAEWQAHILRPCMA